MKVAHSLRMAQPRIDSRPRVAALVAALFGVIALVLGVSFSPIQRQVKVDLVSDLDLGDGHQRYPAVPGFACLRRACTLPIPPKTCGPRVYISQALVDPIRQHDRDGEWVQLRSDSVSQLSLYGWELRTSRSTLQLSSLSIRLGHPLTLRGRYGGHKLGPIQLRNGGDTLSLIDACQQVVSTLRWGGKCPTADPGTVMHSPHVTTPRSSLHDQGVKGGCGQT